MDCSPPGFSVPGISQARILERVAISYSRESSWPRDWTLRLCVSCTGKRTLYHWATWEALGEPGLTLCKFSDLVPGSRSGIGSCYKLFAWLSLGWPHPRLLCLHLHHWLYYHCCFRGWWVCGPSSQECFLIAWLDDKFLPLLCLLWLPETWTLALGPCVPAGHQPAFLPTPGNQARTCCSTWDMCLETCSLGLALLRTLVENRPQLSALWWLRGVGWRDGGREAEGGGEICIYTGDSLCCTPEIHTKLKAVIPQ